MPLSETTRSKLKKLSNGLVQYTSNLDSFIPEIYHLGKINSNSNENFRKKLWNEPYEFKEFDISIPSGFTLSEKGILEGFVDQIPPNDYFIAGIIFENNKFQGIAVFILTILPDPWANWKNLPPPQNTSYFKDSSSMLECQSILGQTIGASQRGRKHAHDGSFREDDYHVKLNDKFVVIAVGDGAGSHSYSREGSRIATRESANMLSSIVEEQYSQIQKFLVEENSTGLNQFYKTSLVTAAYQAWYEIDVEARKNNRQGKGTEKINGKTNGYGTTLLLLLCHRNDCNWNVATFTVGDGAVVSVQKDKFSLLAQPDQGQSAGQTEFLTHIPLDEWQSQKIYERCNIQTIPNLEHIYVMTDGVSDPLLETKAEPWKHLKTQIQTPIETQDENALLDFLSFRERGYHDDRTLVVFTPQTIATEDSVTFTTIQDQISATIEKKEDVSLEKSSDDTNIEEVHVPKQEEEIQGEIQEEIKQKEIKQEEIKQEEIKQEIQELSELNETEEENIKPIEETNPIENNITKDVSEQQSSPNVSEEVSHDD